MKFSGTLNIEKPQAQVAEFFADPKYLGEYQDGFQKKELVSGVAGQEGAVSKLFYKYGKHDMELKETVTKNDLPRSFEAFYEHKHMDNTMKVSFIPVDENNTRYEYEFEYTRMNWVMPKLLAILFPGMYRKQGEKWMWQFKEFVERSQ